MRQILFLAPDRPYQSKVLAPPEGSTYEYRLTSRVGQTQNTGYAVPHSGGPDSNSPEPSSTFMASSEMEILAALTRRLETGP